MNAWRVRFTARILAFALAAELPAGVALASALRHFRVASAAAAPWVTLGLLLAWNVVLVRKLVDWQDDRRTSRFRTWALEVPFFTYGSACFIALPWGWLGLLALGAGALAGLHLPAPWAVLGPIYLVALAWSAWGSSLGRVIPRVRTHEVTLAGLDPAFDGYRIVQLSDVHHGPYLPRWVYRRWAARVRALRPDLVALTGDMITSGVGYVDDVADLVRTLGRSARVVAIMGNHDYFGTTVGVSNAMLHGGATLLRNDGLAITKGDGALWVAGIDDRWSRRDDVAAALRGRPDGAPVVLLAHDPASFPEIAEHGVDLTLSGHTHGGQFAFPVGSRTLNMARLTTRRTAGFYAIGRSRLYVHRGVGTSGPPTRIGVAPEIAVFVLRAGS